MMGRFFFFFQECNTIYREDFVQIKVSSLIVRIGIYVRIDISFSHYWIIVNDSNDAIFSENSSRYWENEWQIESNANSHTDLCQIVNKSYPMTQCTLTISIIRFHQFFNMINVKQQIQSIIRLMFLFSFDVMSELLTFFRLRLLEFWDNVVCYNMTI